MPTGIPGSGKGGYRLPLDRNMMKERLKELEERHKERVQALQLHMQRLDQREKSLGELKAWLAKRKLDGTDLMWMAVQLRPRRAAKAVKSKLPLQPVKPRASPGLIMHKGKLVEPKGDPEFRRRIREARIERKWSSEAAGKKAGVSHATITAWEAGRYVPKEEMRVKLLKVFELPAGLGAEATRAMEAQMVTAIGKRRGNAAAAPG